MVTKDGNRKILAVLAGGLVLGVGVAVTLAAWNDSEFATGTFTAGSFNLEGSTTGDTDAAYSDHNVDLIADGYDCAIRLGYLQDSNLVARRIGPIYGHTVASPAYIAVHGAPETPDQLLSHQALMQGTEAWQFLDGEKIVSIRPQGRFKADNGKALVAAALAGVGIAYLPYGLVHEYLDAGALVPVMTRYPPPPAGAYVVRPPGQHPARKIRILTDLLVAYFDTKPPIARAWPRA